MTLTTNPALPAKDVHHLLGHRSDLIGHVATHGPLQVVVRPNLTWQEGLMASLRESKLTGRGGASFPAVLKLELARSGGRGGTVVVNGMEGEPASDKDKLLLTQATHLVLDGAQYVALLCRADRVVVCIPTGQDVVASSVSAAMRMRAQKRYVNIAEEIVRPPDRFVSGEESALVNWINTGNARPVHRPHKGVALQIGRRTALVHNAETLAHLALIARNGPSPFKRRGLPDEPGTCLVTIGGAVSRPGVVEVDRGTPLWEIAALATPVRSIQSLLVGGYAGSWIGPERFMVPYASGPLRAIGASTGVGVITVLGEQACGITESARIARYLADQSAGQCGSCVHGLPAIASDLTRLAKGQVDANLMSRLVSRLRAADGRGACRHPDGAVRMVRSALEVFADDVADHLRGTPCAHWRKPTVLRFPRPIGL